MYNLLIADDEAVIREGLKCLLNWEAFGFTIDGEAENGKQAYQMMLSKRPDAVLLDIRMPEMLGLDAIREARKAGYQGKIIILSGYSDFKYAQDAIRYGVQYYLTKPIDENELSNILSKIREQLDKEQASLHVSRHYRQKLRSSIVKDILLGNTDFSRINLKEFHLDADTYQVVIYEKFDRKPNSNTYHFSDMLRITNQNSHSFDNVTLDSMEVILLKSSFALQKFHEFLERYEREQRPQKGSPLDSLFLSYGRQVSTLTEVPDSYQDAQKLLARRFFCEQGQHTIGYQNLPEFELYTPIITPDLLSCYTNRLFGALSSFNRSMTAEILKELQDRLYIASDSIDSIRLFLADLYLQIKERMNHNYSDAKIPFPGNAEIIQLISEKYYLYEIILFLTEQFELILCSIGNSSRESVLDDILHYINHNYAKNLTLENIAPLFGYNSSYLGRIFTKKMGESFHSYLDHIRIEQSKELLKNADMKVYEVAEKVGYRTVDYFHIKFKKQVGQTPAEFRRVYK